MKLIGIQDRRYLSQRYISSLVFSYIEKNKSKNKKPRLIEEPSYGLKRIQRRMLALLNSIEIPKFVFSGVKGRSYIQNIRYHRNCKYMFAIDISAFFPSITRNAVYIFFKDQLKCQPDIANCLASLTTVAVQNSRYSDFKEIDVFLNAKGVYNRNHLMTGAPTSSLLSYMVNQNMFNTLHSYAKGHGLKMSIYVDDVYFSSQKPIPQIVQSEIIKIVSKYNYAVSIKKKRYYGLRDNKEITGAIINRKGSPRIKPSWKKRIAELQNQLELTPNNTVVQLELKGLLLNASQIQPSIKRTN